MIDLTKLSPAPWFVHPRTGNVCYGDPTDDRDNYPVDDPDADEFLALARNAFDVLMRRGEGFDLCQTDDKTMWMVDCLSYGWIPGQWPDPFTALVEADRWYVVNVEKMSS